MGQVFNPEWSCLRTIIVVCAFTAVQAKYSSRDGREWETTDHTETHCLHVVFHTRTKWKNTSSSCTMSSCKKTTCFFILFECGLYRRHGVVDLPFLLFDCFSRRSRQYQLLSWASEPSVVPQCPRLQQHAAVPNFADHHGALMQTHLKSEYRWASVGLNFSKFNPLASLFYRHGIWTGWLEYFKRVMAYGDILVCGWRFRWLPLPKNTSVYHRRVKADPGDHFVVTVWELETIHDSNPTLIQNCFKW